MNITMIENKLLVDLLVEETKTSTGIILSGGMMGTTEKVHPHKVFKALVIAVGNESKIVKEGDVVLIEHCFTRPFSYQNMEYKIIKESDIVGVVNDNKDRTIQSDVRPENSTTSTEDCTDSEA